LLAPALCCLLAAALYLIFGDAVGIGLAVWFAWCMTRANDEDHQWLRRFGWVMLIMITLSIAARIALVA
jgi:hypothetical protein